MRSRSARSSVSTRATRAGAAASRGSASAQGERVVTTPKRPHVALAARRAPGPAVIGGQAAVMRRRGRRPRTAIATRTAAATRPAIGARSARKPWRPISQPTLPGAMMYARSDTSR